MNTTTALEFWKDGDLCDYHPILETFGEIILQVDDAGYSGDSRVLYRNGEQFGFLQFGWGSCSGCDALQRCCSAEDLQKLMDELKSGIKWFDTAADALDWFVKHDWEGDYSWDEVQKSFVEKSKEILVNILAIKGESR